METLIGLTSKQVWSLIRPNFRTIPPNHWPDLLKLILIGKRNTKFMKMESEKFADQIAQTEIKQPPVFILGHWRSGTTLLHRLLSLDPQFAYPNVFEVYNPWTFLTTEPMLEARLKKIAPKKRPMDNMVMSFNDPAEDEFAISLLSLKSPLIGWAFPRNEAYFDRYLTLHNISEEERVAWKQTFVYFLKKMTVKDNRQLLLKSPHHTARVKTLLEIFPEAKFIHIRRNPYDIFRSTVSLYQKTVTGLSLQHRNPQDDIVAIINRFKAMYNFFLHEKKMIPQGSFFEMTFEELEKDFVTEIERIYTHLHFPGWENYNPLLSQYLASQPEYQKNTYPPIENKWKQAINQTWGFIFKEWDYAIEQ